MNAIFSLWCSIAYSCSPVSLTRTHTHTHTHTNKLGMRAFIHIHTHTQTHTHTPSHSALVGTLSNSGLVASHAQPERWQCTNRSCRVSRLDWRSRGIANSIVLRRDRWDLCNPLRRRASQFIQQYFRSNYTNCVSGGPVPILGRRSVFVHGRTVCRECDIVHVGHTEVALSDVPGRKQCGRSVQ